MFSPNSYEYFLQQKLNRYNFIRNLLSNWSKEEIKNKSFLSIGCGLAGEESWIVDQFKEVLLIDKDESTLNLAKEYYEKDNIKGNHKFQKYSIGDKDKLLDKKFDIIFTSSPSDWMNKQQWELPTSWIEFIVDNLTEDGMFIFRAYGGSNSSNIKKSEYKKILTDHLTKNANNLKVQGIWNISKNEYDMQNKLDGLPEEVGKGRGTQVFGIITKSILINDESVSYFNYDKDNIYQLQFLKTWNKEEYIDICQKQIKILKKSKLKKKLLTKEFI
mgnify:CR=1 FL=1